MRVFKTRTFARWNRKASLPDATPRKAVDEMTAGLIDADLGSGIYKKRVPMAGRGKRGGARVIVGTYLGTRWFFIFGFEKSERATIDDRELAVLQKTAAILLEMDANALDRALAAGELTEMGNEKKPNPR